MGHIHCGASASTLCGCVRSRRLTHRDFGLWRGLRRARHLAAVGFNGVQRWIIVE
jgi:hypothetical protein